MRPSRGPVNRVLLGLLGAGLVVGGGWVAVTALVERGDVGFGLPGWWPTPDAGARLLDRDSLSRMQGYGWWVPVVFAVSAVLFLAFVWWFLAQTRTRRQRNLTLPAPEVRLRTRALARAVEADADRLPEVSGSRARIDSTRARPRVTLTVDLEPRAEPAGVLRALVAGPVERARTATGADRVDTVVRFRNPRHRAGRVE
ncbi:alkaline shock response membrane anchor protein AmaP [Streptomyces sp. NPDC091292]|uniref:alkaline shock response membrane anchor protein AmaP n=1 Tax=Streptomyces sp. NPDC091292 TaxID=3365991 RepID=UPI0037F42CD2